MRSTSVAACVGFVVAAHTGFSQTMEASAALDERAAQLEKLIEAQQKRLENLQGTLAASAGQDVEVARTEALKAQIREVLGEREFRESLMGSTMQAGYDKGFYVKSSDEKFLMKFYGLLQVRWDYYSTRASNRYRNPGAQRNDRTGFEIPRARFGIQGHVYSKDLTYALELRSDVGRQNDTDIESAYVNYRFRDEFQIRAGTFRLASTRAQVTSSSKQQAIDRPPSDAVFGLGIGTGVRFWGLLFDKRFEYNVDVVNSLNNQTNRVISPDPSELDGNPAILFRTVWHALGDDPVNDCKLLSDLPKHTTPALDIGFHYAFNDDAGDRGTTRIPFPLGSGPGQGGFGLTTTNGLQIHQFGWDGVFKYMGFSAHGEYILRIVDVRQAYERPFAPWYLLTTDSSTVAQHGAYVQVGYFLPIAGLEDKLEAIARVGGISTLAGEREGTWEYSAGFNYYFFGNDVKLQMDVTKISEVPISSTASSMANVNDDALVFRMQMQLSF